VWRITASIAAVEHAISGRPRSAHASARKLRASTASSRSRSRSGGSVSFAPRSRKYRSWRNRPAAISASRSRLVAATKRTSIARSWTLPTRSTRLLSSARSSLAWMFSGSSPTSSRNTVPPSAASS